MSAGKVSEARAELEEVKLITVERPPDRTKPVVVTIVDIWPKNFLHFSRVQNMNTSRSEYETKKEPLEESSLKEQDKPAVFDEMTINQKQAALIEYLDDRHTERELDRPTTRQKQRLAGELGTHIKRGVAKADLYFALDKMVEAKRRGVSLELYQALSDGAAKNNVTHLRPNRGPSEQMVSTSGYREFS